MTYRKLWYRANGRVMFSLVYGELKNAERVAAMHRQRGIPTLIDVTPREAKAF